MRKKDTDRRNLAIAAVVILGLIIVGGYMLLSGDGGGGGGGGDSGGADITSINFLMKGYEAGQLGGNTRFRAEGIGSDAAKLRIDKIGAKDILIFNYEENAEYAYTGTSWMKFPITQTSPYSGIPFEEWAQKGEGAYTVEFGGYTVEITINAVNPQLPDNIFTPPEDADVKEVEPS